MLEIIAIISLSRSVSSITKAKGLNPTRYVVFTIVMWIGFEIMGSLVGLIVVGEGLAIYPFALAGACLGGYLGYSFAKSAIPKSQRDKW